MTIDKIGLFKGKNISEMTREELLEFAEWAAKELATLQKIAGHRLVQNIQLNREMLNLPRLENEL